MHELTLPLKSLTLVTAHIIYRLPDYPSLVQSYVWQEYDAWPWLPRLDKFLQFWERSLDGKLVHVSVAHRESTPLPPVRHIGSPLLIN